VLAGLLSPASARAMCDVIPGATNVFRGATGSLDRPFAMPGDVIELRVRPAVCDGESTGLVDLPGGATFADDYQVTVLFEPPGGGPRNAVVVTTADCASLAPALAACEAQLGAGGSASCEQVGAGPDLTVIPDPIEGRLRFRFPDTDPRVGTVSDDRTLAGPATLVVTAAGAPLACDLAGPPRCADRTGLVACIDELYAIDGTCGTATLQIGSTFGHFVALPPPNDYQALCDTAGTPCMGTAGELRFTTDVLGNVLVPMDYRGVLVRLEDVPVPRLVRGSTTIPAFSGSSTPVQVPSQAFLSAWSPKGHRIPPLFTPITDPSNPSAATLFGSVDAPVGAFRVARRACLGGTEEGRSCTADAHCPGLGATCSAPLFDFTDRYDADVGPVVVTDSGFDADAENPVPLDGLVETPDAFAFAINEGLANEDLNGDGDELDQVVTLRDRETGEVLPIGPGGAQGRAVVRVRQGRFAFAAVEAKDDLVGFLESEPNQGYTDTNANGNVFDSVLRVFRVGPGSATELTNPLAPPTADGAFTVGANAFEVGDAQVYFAAREAALAASGTERVSVGDGGVPGNAASDLSSATTSSSGSLSSDARFAAFRSLASNLDGAVSDTNAVRDVFVRDRLTGDTELVSIASETGDAANGASSFPSISADGRFVAFSSDASDLVAGDDNGVRDVFVRDRQDDTTARVSVNGGGGAGNGTSDQPAISGDGRFLAFQSTASNLVAGDSNASTDVFVHDRDTDGDGVFDEPGSIATVRVSVAGNGAQGTAPSDQPAISADGRFVAFRSSASLVAPDANGSVSDIFVRDRDTDMDGLFDEPDAVATLRVSESGTGVQANGSSASPALSANGRFVAFYSAGTNLVAGDTNGSNDVFVRDRQAATTERVSVSSAGTQGDAESLFPELSADGRFVVFESDATNLVPGDLTGKKDAFVHDRATSSTLRVSFSPDCPHNNFARGFAPSISPDGRLVLFVGTRAMFLCNADDVGEVFVHGPIAFSVDGDLSADGDNQDSLLRSLDSVQAAPIEPDTLCPVEGEVAAADDRAAFLRPEAAGPACDQLDADLNDDGDTNDLIVQERPAGGGAVVNHALAARAVAASVTALATLVSETDEDGQILNDDGDTDDLVLAVHTGATWTMTGAAGDAIGVAGSLVAVATPEASQGADLNEDDDLADRVLQVADATGPITSTGQSLIDFVVGEGFVAFRTRECDEGAGETDGCPSGGTDLNGDGDAADAVLQVWVSTGPAAGFVHSTGQAALACEFEACDPRFPYRVAGSTVTFLTLECQQGGGVTLGCPGGGTDLNGDGDADDLVLQVLNVSTIQPPEDGFQLGSFEGQAQAFALESVTGESIQAVAAASAGFCTSTGSPCAFDADCGSGTCFVPPGECVLDLDTACSPGSPGTCPVGQFCRPLTSSPSLGTCHQVQEVPATCKTSSECIGPAQCEEKDQQLQRVLAPVTSAMVAGGETSGAQIFASTGTCVETLATSCALSTDCEPGQYCRDGSCQRAHGTCATEADCTAGTCTKDLLITATAADSDGDGLADPLDDCPNHANPDQADTDGDGIGDACDLATCGDGVQAYQEGCDDGNLVPGDGCDASCQTEGIACSNGLDDDGDGVVDFGADFGCESAADVSERGSATPGGWILACDDGIDNDGDGWVDYPTDPGCFSPAGRRENPACSDGVDNDGDGAIDVGADPGCTRPWDTSERSSGSQCGLGFEVALLLPPLAWLRRRRGSSLGQTS
jgi:cysteine-rich repeat protein